LRARDHSRRSKATIVSPTCSSRSGRLLLHHWLTVGMLLQLVREAACEAVLSAHWKRL
jgi:hypothetical protein